MCKNGNYIASPYFNYFINQNRILFPGKREGLAVLVSGFDNTGIWAVSDKLERDMDLADKAGSPVIRANPLKEIPDPKELGLSDFRKDSP